jgi:hypothetical protein
MSWMGPAAKSSAKLAVKYGPHALKAWEVAGPKIKETGRAKLDEATARRKAFEDADSRVEGAVLRVPHHGSPVFVVFTRDEPVESYPPVEEPLADVVARVDLARRVTPAERRERMLRVRAAKVQAKAREKARRRARGRGRSGRGRADG